MNTFMPLAHLTDLANYREAGFHHCSESTTQVSSCCLAIQYYVEKCEISIWGLISISLVNDLETHQFIKQQEFPEQLGQTFGMNLCVGRVRFHFGWKYTLLYYSRLPRQ